MYKHLIIWASLSVYTIVSGTVSVCIPFNQAENTGQLEDYSALVKVLKRQLTELLADDPSQFYDHLDFDFHHPAISAKGELNNVTVSNLDDYELKFFNNVNVWGNKIEVFNLTFHSISASGEYDMTGNIGDLFDIFGEGDFWVNPVNFSVSASSKLPDINGTHACLSLDVDVSLQKMPCWFSNLMNDDELEDLINRAIEAVGPEAVDVIWSEFKDVADGPLQQWIDSVINGHAQYILTKIVRLKKDQTMNTEALNS